MWLSRLVLLSVAFASTAPLAAQVYSGASSPTRTHQRRQAQMSTVNLMGQVVMEDGQPIVGVVQVELICNGRISQQAVTTSDGRFLIEVGSPRTEDWLDPGVGGSSLGSVEGVAKVGSPSGATKLDEVPSVGIGRVSLSGCEVRAAPRAGLVSNVISLSTRDAFENPDIGLIVLKKLSHSSATTVSLSVLSAPPEVREAYERASQSLRKNPPDLKSAEKDLRKAVKKHPEFAGAWDLLGRVLMMKDQRGEALKAFELATQQDPGFIPPLEALARAGVQDSDWNAAWRWSLQLLELDARHPSALYWNGLAGYHLRRWSESERSLSSLYAMGYGREYPFGWLPLGVMHAQNGRIQAAAESFENYLANTPADQVPAPQRQELEELLNRWKSAGLLSLRQP